MSTLYRCSGYVEEICEDRCEYGEPHKESDCCILNGFCPFRDIDVQCIEYDRDPCGDPKCPDCTGGDGMSCK